MEKEQINYEKVLATWHFPENIKQDRGIKWYLITFSISISLIIYSIINANFSFALIIVMVVLILIIQNKKDLKELDINITETGIKIDQKVYKYSEIDTFFIIYQPPEISNLYIEPKNKFQARLTIPLQKQNPVKIRNILLNFLDENLEREEEPLSDLVNKILKF